jgi:hypothetical protein
VERFEFTVIGKIAITRTGYDPNMTREEALKKLDSMPNPFAEDPTGGIRPVTDPRRLKNPPAFDAAVEPLEKALNAAFIALEPFGTLDVKVLATGLDNVDDIVFQGHGIILTVGDLVRLRWALEDVNGVLEE